MVKSYACAGILLFAIGLFPLMAQDNTVAKELSLIHILCHMALQN